MRKNWSKQFTASRLDGSERALYQTVTLQGLQGRTVLLRQQPCGGDTQRRDGSVNRTVETIVSVSAAGALN